MTDKDYKKLYEEVPEEYIYVLLEMERAGKIKSLAYSFNPDGSCEIYIEPVKANNEDEK